jgi:hypothetical protein
MGELASRPLHHSGLIREGRQRSPVRPQRMQHQGFAAGSLRRIEQPLGLDAVAQHHRRRHHLQRIMRRRAIGRHEAGQVVRHRLRQRKHQQARVLPAPDGLELIDLGLNVLRVLSRHPGVAHPELLAVARPGRPRLIDRALEGQRIAGLVEQHSGLRMVEGTIAAELVGPAGMVQRQRDAHVQQPRADHPGQGPQPVARDLVHLRPPASRQPEPLAVRIGWLEMPQQAGSCSGPPRGPPVRAGRLRCHPATRWPR